MRIIRIATIFLGILISAFSARAQVAVNAYNCYTSQGWREILLEFDIAKGWHIFAPYEQEFGQPLTVEWKLPEDAEIIENSFTRPQRFEIDDFSYDGYKDKAFYKTTIKNDGVWRNLPVNISWQACADDECLPQSKQINVLPQKSSEFEAKIKEAVASFTEQNNIEFSWLWAAIMAFGAGIILNLMPCVLPVLGLKILSCMKTDAAKRFREAFFYTLGIVISMLVLALILWILRRTDHHLGWGFQMQNIWFVGAMLVVFIILTLLSFEIININFGWLNKIAGLHFKNCRLDAFASGILAVLIASPCTAPFMGAAIGYAIMAPVYIYFPIFLSLGLGYALPFALLVMFPRPMQKIMPRPGKWMRILKIILGIPLLLTCLWLGWLLSSQLGLKINSSHINWQEYSSAKVEQAIKNKQPVFIDFTADWCITCLVNKKTSLNSDAMLDLIKNKNILLLKADITTMNKEAAQGLKKYNRAGVPLYVYYDGKSDDYLILPPILTPQILLDYIK